MIEWRDPRIYRNTDQATGIAIESVNPRVMYLPVTRATFDAFGLAWPLTPPPAQPTPEPSPTREP